MAPGWEGPQRAPSNAAGLLVFQCEPLAQPSLGASRPACGGKLGGNPSSRSPSHRGSPASHRDGVLCAQSPGRADPDRPGPGSSPEPGRGQNPFETASARPGRGHGLFADFASSRDTQHPRASPRPKAEEAAHALQSHIIKVNIGTRREAGVGGLQMHADHAVDGGLHLSEIILRNLGAHRWSVIRN